jgi:hypothetical protein
MKDLFQPVDLDLETTSFIAAGLRELAAVDGVHEAELALIEEFERDCGVSEVKFDLRGEHPLKTDALREVFMRSAILLAMADNEISELEGVRLGQYAHHLGIDVARLAELYRDVKVFLFSAFEGAELFRDQAEQIGEDLGLEDVDITSTLQ